MAYVMAADIVPAIGCVVSVKLWSCRRVVASHVRTNAAAGADLSRCSRMAAGACRPLLGSPEMGGHGSRGVRYPCGVDPGAQRVHLIHWLTRAAGVQSLKDATGHNHGHADQHSYGSCAFLGRLAASDDAAWLYGAVPLCYVSALKITWYLYMCRYMQCYVCRTKDICPNQRHRDHLQKEDNLSDGDNTPPSAPPLGPPDCG